MAIRLQGTVSRVLAAALAIAMVTAPQPVSAAGPSEIERLYVEGQERYGSGDFAGAADSWTRLLEQLPEAQANKATRENVLLNAVQACIDAYNRSRREDGTKDIEHLKKGKAVLDKYYADYNRAYGDRAGVSQAVEEKTNDLDGELKKAEDEANAATGTGTPTDTPTDTPTTTPTDQPPEKKVIVLEPQNAGNGLIVGGSVVGALGIGALVMGIIGAVRAPKAEDAYKQAVEDGDEIARQKADFDGKQANKLTIAGFVLAPLLLGGGAAMLVIGIQRKQKAARESGSVAVTPAFGPGFSGISLSGKF